MKNDTLIRIEGMDVLVEKLGLVEAERFIMLIKRESFDYTRWRENQFNDKSLEDIFTEAAALRARTKKRDEAPASSAKPKTGKKSAGGRKAAKHPAHT